MIQVVVLHDVEAATSAAGDVEVVATGVDVVVVLAGVVETGAAVEGGVEVGTSLTTGVVGDGLLFTTSILLIVSFQLNVFMFATSVLKSCSPPEKSLS